LVDIAFIDIRLITKEREWTPPKMDFKNLYKYTQNLHLLYVEDDENLREETVEILEDFFASVEVCGDGAQGLEKYRAFYKKNGLYFDIVITDINMPVMNGIDMSEQIMALNPKQSIFVVSAYNEPHYLTKLINMGVDKFLIKPLQTKQLVQALYKKSKDIYNEKLSDEYHDKLANMTNILEKQVKERTRQLEHQLSYDNLTGLFNRHVLSEDLKKEHFTMLSLVDIDRLQFINDIYGPEVGNQVIIKVANILSTYARETGCKLYRTSGDEFALAHKSMSYEESFAFITNLSKMTTNMNLFIEDIVQEVNVDTTIGLALQSDNILTHADIALKHAKNNHHQYVIYNNALNSLHKMQEIVAWKNKIETAIATNNIIPVFQPIVDTKGDILKYETLMRLRIVEEGKEKLISPYFFLDTAIETKLYPQLSHTIISAALESLKSGDHTLSINLTYNDFTNPEIIDLLTHELSYHDIGNRLIFEIVESENIGDYAILKNFIDKFRTFGVRIAIDDFGAGFSSFQHIVQTSPDYIKIDGSLVKDIDSDLSSLTIVKAIVQFSQELGIQVIAEFVHSEHILNILQSLGIKEFQGFYFYEPKPELVHEKEFAEA
jgi:diguanylate cyclase (GGDEF)-like protein